MNGTWFKWDWIIAFLLFHEICQDHFASGLCVTALSAWNAWFLLIHMFCFLRSLLNPYPWNRVIFLCYTLFTIAIWNILICLFVYCKLQNSKQGQREQWLHIAHSLLLGPENCPGNEKCSKLLVEWRKLNSYNNQPVANC